MYYTLNFPIMNFPFSQDRMVELSEQFLLFTLELFLYKQIKRMINIFFFAVEDHLGLDHQP